MRLIKIQSALSDKDTTISIKARVSEIYQEYQHLTKILDDISYQLFKQKQSLFYQTKESPQKAIEIILNHQKKIAVINAKSSRIIEAKLTYECTEIIEAINQKDLAKVERIIKDFPQTISRLKHIYALQFFPELKRDKSTIEIIKRNFLSTKITDINHVKEMLEIGDIIIHVNLSSRKGIVQRIIKSVTSSLVSHVGLYIGDMQVIESSRTKVLQKTLYDHKGQVLLILRPPISTPQKEILIRKIQSKIEMKYSKKELLGHVAIKYFGRLPKLLVDKNAYFCSEIIDELFKSIGIYLTPNSGSQITNPADIAESKLLKEVCIIDGSLEGNDEEDNFLEVIKKTERYLEKLLAT